MSDDYDTPWKDALQRYFPEFMSFYFPSAHAEIDWSVPWDFLEQELAQVSRDAETGARRVDKLVRVTRARRKQMTLPARRWQQDAAVCRLTPRPAAATDARGRRPAVERSWR